MWDPKEQAAHEAHLGRVSLLRDQVTQALLDPAKPCSYPRGSYLKMALMTLRSEMEIPLFVDGDNPNTGDCAQVVRIQDPPVSQTKRHRLRMGRAA